MLTRIAMSLLIGSACLASAVLPATAQENVLTMSGSGGVVADTNAKTYIPAFEKATGWKIKQVASEAKRMAELETMVKVGKTLWDVSEISASDYPISVAKGLLEPIDYSIVDPKNELPAAARKKFAVAVASYSTVLVQRLDKNPAGKKMQSWTDFWDVNAFPGPRSLNKRPQYNLEFALLADGVAKDDIYKVLSTKDGVDRAFKKLDQIKPHISVWWESGAQSIQLLQSGEVAYTTTFNGRIGSLQKGGLPVEIVWNGGVMHVSHVGIPKGSPNRKAAMDFVRFRALSPEVEREYIKVIPYPGFSKAVFEGMPADVVAQMPSAPANVALQFEANEEFWAANLQAISERWNEWLLK